MERQNFEYFYRQRLNIRLQDKEGKPINKLVLNEVFAAEVDVGKTSIYKLTVDGRKLGKFKSSGIIIATGTGSSGWLLSSRKMT